MITQQRLKQLLEYVPETGRYIWAQDITKYIRKGSPVKGNASGQIQLDGKKFELSRLTFLYMTGEIPEGVVCYKNNCSIDKRWENLIMLPEIESYRRDTFIVSSPSVSIKRSSYDDGTPFIQVEVRLNDEVVTEVFVWEKPAMEWVKKTSLLLQLAYLDSPPKSTFF